MGQADTLLALRVPADAAELKGIRTRLQEALQTVGIGEACRQELVVAVNEACMNIIQHAYGNQHHGDIVIELERTAGWLTFRITDYAPPVDFSQLHPRDLSDVRPGGLGLCLIHTIMDEIRYPPPPAGVGNVVEMRKRYLGAT